MRKRKFSEGQIVTVLKEGEGGDDQESVKPSPRGPHGVDSPGCKALEGTGMGAARVAGDGR